MADFLDREWAGGSYWSGSILSCRLVRGFSELFLQGFVGSLGFSAGFAALLVIPLAESGVDLKTFAGKDDSSRCDKRVRVKLRGMTKPDKSRA